MIPMSFEPSQWDAAWIKVQCGWSGCCDKADMEGALNGGEIGEPLLDELLWQVREDYLKGQV
jgi:hypothetical protein